MARLGTQRVDRKERKQGERESRVHGKAGVESYDRVTKPDMQWWTGDHESGYQRVLRVAHMLYAADQSRRAKLREHERLYTARTGLPFSRTGGASDRLGRRLSLNAIKSCVDTSGATIGKSKPKPQFLTVDGTWTLQEKAKALTAYLEGAFGEIGIYDVEELTFRDARVFDVGTIYIGHEMKKIGGKNRKRIKCDRVLPDELLLNPSEAYYGKPQMVMRRHFVDRGLLMGMFKKSGLYGADIDDADRETILEKIRMAPQPMIDATERLVEGHSMVEVVEAWHLPSSVVESDEGEDSEPTVDDTDGRHALVIDGQTLIWEPWTKAYLPFVFMYWTPPVAGFFGTGLAEELAPIQYELNEALKRVQIAQRHACAPKVFVPTGAKIAKGKLGNDLRVEVINFDGPRPPTFVTPNAMPTEVYTWIQTLWTKCFETTGISQMSASSKKDPGITAAVAIREIEDIESGRFVLIGQRREQLFMDAAKIVIDMSRDLAKKDPDLAVTGSAGKMVRRIKWKDVDLEDEQYTMRVYPVSLLPSTPAGKLQKVSELLDNGFIDREQGLQMLDFPDVEKFTGLATAALEDAQMVVDSMVNGGEYIPPEPFMDLALSRRICVSTYLRARTRGVDERELDKLRQFIGECENLLAKAAGPGPMAPSGPVAGPGPGIPAPGAMPGPPPPMTGPVGVPMPPRAA